MEERRMRASASFVAVYKPRLSRSVGSDHLQSSFQALAFVFKARKIAARRSRSQPDCFEPPAFMAIEVNATAYLRD